MILFSSSSYRSSPSKVFLEKGVLKICSKFTGEHPCWSAISKTVWTGRFSEKKYRNVSQTITTSKMELIVALVSDFLNLFHKEHYLRCHQSLKCTSEILYRTLTCCALRDLVPFVQFKKREKRPWRSVDFSKVAGWILQLY